MTEFLAALVIVVVLGGGACYLACRYERGRQESINRALGRGSSKGNRYV